MHRIFHYLFIISHLYKETRIMSMSYKHPYKYIDLKSVSDSLLCSVCKFPFVDPVSTTDGRYGCRLCFEGVENSVKPVQEFLILAMLNGIGVICPGCGSEKITRGQLAQHERNECPQANVSCRAADIKCPWRGTLRELDDHMEQCIFEPLRPALQELVEENKKLKERVQKLEQSQN